MHPLPTRLPGVGQVERRIRIGGAILLVAIATYLMVVGPSLAPASDITFSDVPHTHPYHDAIYDLAGRGIILGFPDGTFGPDLLVTRQQFAKTIVLTLGLPVSEADTCPFTDVESSEPPSLYPDHYVAVCAAHHITRGTGPDTFSPYLDIPRCQVITMVVRAIQALHPASITEPEPGYTSTWGDFDPTHAACARIAERNGLLTGLGKDGAHPQGNLAALSPFESMPRGEVAQVLHNLLQLLTPPTSTTTSGTTTTTGPPAGDLLHVWWKGTGDWHVENVSEAVDGGIQLTGDLTGFGNHFGAQNTYVVGVSPEHDLTVFRTPFGGRSWTAANIGAQIGEKVVSNGFCAWYTDMTSGKEKVHLMATAVDGDLLHVWWRIQSNMNRDWSCENVTDALGLKVIGNPVVFRHEPAGAAVETTVAARGVDDHLLLFYCRGIGEWTVEDVTEETGVTYGGDLNWWVGEPFENALGVVDTTGDFWILERSGKTAPWSATNVSDLIGRTLNGFVLTWTADRVAPEPGAHFMGTSADHHLIHFWYSSSHEWQSEDLTVTLGQQVRTLMCIFTLASWFDDLRYFNYLCGVAPNGDLLLIWNEESAASDGHWSVVNASSVLGYQVQPWEEGWWGDDFVQELAIVRKQ